MPIDQESFNTNLYKLLKTRGYKPVPKDAKNQRTDPNNAEVFNFTFTKDGKEYGDAWVTIDDASNVVLYYSNEQEESPSGKSPGLDYDDSWSGLKRHLKQWSMNKQLTFELRNKDELGDDMAQRDYVKKKEKMNETKEERSLWDPSHCPTCDTRLRKVLGSSNAQCDKCMKIVKVKLKKHPKQMAEGYHPMGKKASYNDNIPAVKIILQHNRQIEEGEQRYRNIAKIFLENQDGERFLAPTTRPGIAQVYARHIAEGGVPNDERWNHIKSICEEYSKMAGFVRATKNKQFNESAQSLVNEGINHYQSLRETLGKLRGHRGYNQYFESWTPALMEDDVDGTQINELFVQETVDPRIESVMPILSRLYKKTVETPVKEVKELEQWADSIVEGDHSGEEYDIAALQRMFGPETAHDAASHKPAMMNRKDNKGKTHSLVKLPNGNYRSSGVDEEEETLEEDLDAVQKCVGQLGPTEKVSKAGAVDKLVGVSESVSDSSNEVISDLINGNLDAYDVMNHPRTPAQQKVAGIMQQMYDDITTDNSLHGDDDFEEILSKVVDRLEDQYGNNLNETSDYFTRGVERAWARGEPLETVMKKHGREAVPIWKKLEHESNLKEVCSDCAGHGEDEEGLVCGSCEGTGEVESSREDDLEYIKRLLR